MKLSTQEKKQRAIDALKMLCLSRTYIKDFEENGRIYLFEDFVAKKIRKKSELAEKIAKIEMKGGCNIYAVTHEMTEVGEMFTFLLISEYSEDVSITPVAPLMYRAYAYVWNKDREYFSEYGTVTIQSFDGGIRRLF